MRPIGWLALTLPVVLGACGERAPELGIERAIVRLSPNPAAPSVAYFTIKGGPVDERLISVSSPVVVRAEMHDNMRMDTMTVMTPIKGGVPVPAGKEVRFEEGGKHVMLFTVNPRVKPDETMLMVFTFASGNKFQIQASVRRPGQLI